MAERDASFTFNPIDPEFTRCPQHHYRSALEQCPVSRSPLTGGVLVAAYEDVMWCLRHPEIFSSEMADQMSLGNVRPMIPQQIDPPRQTRFRKILDPLFSRKRMNELAPSLRADAVALIEGFYERGECEYNGEFAVPLPANAFLHLMGMPSSDRDYFVRLKDGIIRPHVLAETDDIEEPDRIRADSGQQIYDYFQKTMNERRKSPREDLMTYFVNAELDGRKLTDEEILDICFLFIIAGLDTVTATLGCDMVYLASNPSERQKLLDDPAMLDTTIEELLRWETPVAGIPRIVKQDVEFGGLELKVGDMVLLMLGAANLDDAEFERANDVDLARDRNRHIAFGAGAHRCLGSHLARMELNVALEEWHARIPHYRIKEGVTLEYSIGIREVKYLPLEWDVK
jgi:cytochrome P450